ncbi:MAG: hypothetical protein KME21_10040 [Desmonostoc vinosum HA7617-LM4]|nr:hypothetical protein [Desmonostoc vinosum HA7617-LM4]
MGSGDAGTRRKFLPHPPHPPHPSSSFHRMEARFFKNYRKLNSIPHSLLPTPRN